ncbi:MATE family efflux transporter [Pseudomonas purpurea]|uniref:MATE family efflux transporter n=1 Tax=Pseudomonas purpurea TaxID=3136737 RepID=UPI00326420C5
MSAPSSVMSRGALHLAWPILIEQLLRLSVGLIDTFMISHISDQAVAAVGSTNQINVLAILLFGPLAIGSSILTTHHLGANDPAGANRIARNAMTACTWLGLIISALVLLFPGDIFAALHLTFDLRELAYPFLMLVGGTLFIEAQMQCLCAILRANGHTKAPMIVALAQNILTLGGNYLLLYGHFGLPELGVLGVSISTVVSRIIACCILWFLVKRHTGFVFEFKHIVSFDPRTFKRILQLGLPAAGEGICWFLGYMTITALCASLGGNTLATLTYTIQIVLMVMVYSIAIGLATEIIVGHMIGAGDIEAANRQLHRSLKIGLMIAVPMSITVACATPFLLALFTDNPEIISTGAKLMLIGLILEPGRVLNFVVVNALRATGDIRYILLVAPLSIWGIMVLGGWTLAAHFELGLIGIWIAMTLDEWCRGLLMYRRWRSGQWKQHAHQARLDVTLEY